MTATMNDLVRELGALTAALHQQGQAASQTPQPEPLNEAARAVLQQNSGATIDDLLNVLCGGQATPRVRVENAPVLSEVKALRTQIGELQKLILDLTKVVSTLVNAPEAPTTKKKEKKSKNKHQMETVNQSVS